MAASPTPRSKVLMPLEAASAETDGCAILQRYFVILLPLRRSTHFTLLRCSAANSVELCPSAH